MLHRRSTARHTRRPSRRPTLYRPQLFSLEDRLPPGDAFLGPLVGAGLLGANLAVPAPGARPVQDEPAASPFAGPSDAAQVSLVFSHDPFAPADVYATPTLPAAVAHLSATDGGTGETAWDWSDATSTGVFSS